MKEKKTLRYFQNSACQEAVKAWKRGERPVLSIFTALGKALIISAIANWCVKQKDGKARVLIFCPTKELVLQNFQEAYEYFDSPSMLGIICSQLNKKQVRRQCCVAMYQSYHSIRSMHAWDYVIIDEAAGVGNNSNSRYREIFRSILRINPDCKFLGLDATPWKLGQGLLTESCVKGEAFFNSIPYNTYEDPGIPKLIEEGYLAKIETLNTSCSINLDGVKMSGSDYLQSDVGLKFDQICDDIVDDMRRHVIENDIETGLVFVSTITNAQKVMDRWGDPSTMRFICGDKNITSTSYRDQSIKWLKDGKGKRFLLNVGLLTVGFNCPHLQSVFIMRATTSSALLIQIIGRLVRPFGDKVGLLCDYGSNISRLGGIENITIPKTKKKKSEPPKKVCVLCNTLNNLSAKSCVNQSCRGEFISTDETGKYMMVTHEQAMKIKRESKITTHKILSYEPEKCISSTGKPYVKLKFVDYVTGRVIHSEFMWLGSDSRFSSQAEAMVRFLYRDVNDFFALGDDALDADLFCRLFIDNNQYFKRCVELKLEPKEGSKYKKIVPGSIIFE